MIFVLVYLLDLFLNPYVALGYKKKFNIFSHSLRKLFTGLAIAAFTDWKLMVNSAINTDTIATTANVTQVMSIR